MICGICDLCFQLAMFGSTLQVPIPPSWLVIRFGCCKWFRSNSYFYHQHSLGCPEVILAYVKVGFLSDRRSSPKRGAGFCLRLPSLPGRFALPIFDPGGGGGTHDLAPRSSRLHGAAGGGECGGGSLAGCVARVFLLKRSRKECATMD